jgi:hypothetical protein
MQIYVAMQQKVCHSLFRIASSLPFAQISEGLKKILDIAARIDTMILQHIPRQMQESGCIEENKQ